MVWCSNRAVTVGRDTSMTHRNQTAIPPQIGCWENRVAPHGADGADGSKTKAPVLRWLRAVLPLRILLDTGVKSRRFGYQTERNKGTHLIGQGASWAHNAYKRRWGYNARARIRKPGPSTPSSVPTRLVPLLRLRPARVPCSSTRAEPRSTAPVPTLACCSLSSCRGWGLCPAQRKMATVSENGRASGTVGYPTFDDAPFVNRAILILDGGTENYPIQNKWIRCALYSFNLERFNIPYVAQPLSFAPNPN